ncbi:hypothetical protein EVAR_101617_1, partial [Eumeta japonica]
MVREGRGGAAVTADRVMVDCRQPQIAGDETSEQFTGNATASNYFRILDKDDFSSSSEE